MLGVGQLLLHLLLLVVRGGLLGQDVLLQLLQLGHVPLQVGKLLLVGHGVLLEGGQRGLVLLLQLSLLLDLRGKNS